MMNDKRTNNKNVFIMTIDVDGWSSLLNFYAVKHNPIEAEEQVNINTGIANLLNIFKKHDIFTTFFITSKVAENNNSIIRKIKQKGHEIACHGLIHDKNEFLTHKEKQKQNIIEATKIINKIIGCNPLGFRAPCLRLNIDTLNILHELGYAYDSSIVPTFIPGYYGQFGVPSKPYYPLKNVINDERHSILLELPVSINPILPLPLSAAWMRNLGSSWVKFGIKMNFLLRHPVIFYIHPRDVLNLPNTKGVPWHIYKNVGVPTITMLNEIIDYAKKMKAEFLTAIEYTKLWNRYF